MNSELDIRPPQRVLSSFLHSFVGSSHGSVPFQAVKLPALGLSEGDKQCIRDRSSIMARHFFADKGEEFINAQLPGEVDSTQFCNCNCKEPCPPLKRNLAESRSRSAIIQEPFVESALTVNALLHSLDIDNDLRMNGHLPGRFTELEEYWNESQGTLRSVPHAADRWVAEYNMQGAHGNPDSWADSFERQHGANGWVSEFEQVSDI
ncbi:hypothetical protein ACLOJK_015340 [Asimina triloba]